MIDYTLIKKHYEVLTPQIFERSHSDPSAWVGPYHRDIDWPKIFSPIEMDTWMVIRGLGYVPLYPQYPVGNHFADFGNPFLQIAVECDGKEYHQDKQKDMARDLRFYELGWTVYRISGSDIVRIHEIDYEKEGDELEDQFRLMYSKTIEGLIKALAIKYCDYGVEYEFETAMAMKCLEDRKGKWK